MQRKLGTHYPKPVTYIFNRLLSDSVANTALYLNTGHRYTFLLKLLDTDEPYAPVSLFFST